MLLVRFCHFDTQLHHIRHVVRCLVCLTSFLQHIPELLFSTLLKSETSIITIELGVSRLPFNQWEKGSTPMGEEAATGIKFFWSIPIPHLTSQADIYRVLGNASRFFFALRRPSLTTADESYRRFSTDYIFSCWKKCFTILVCYRRKVLWEQYGKWATLVSCIHLCHKSDILMAFCRIAGHYKSQKLSKKKIMEASITVIWWVTAIPCYVSPT